MNGWRMEAGQKAALQEQVDARLNAEQDAAKLSHDYEQDRERRRTATQTAERKLYHARQNNPAFACPVPDTGLLLYNQPRAVADPARQPD